MDYATNLPAAAAYQSTNYLDFYAHRRVLITGGWASSAPTWPAAGGAGQPRCCWSIRWCRTTAATASTSPASRIGVQVNIADVRDPHAMNALVPGHDVLFNLAGQVSHLDSMADPFTDLEINARSQLFILEACRHHNPEIKIVYAGTRQSLRPAALPAAGR
jgi:nucleoside-diphosphate-sugar epimerase